MAPFYVSDTPITSKRFDERISDAIKGLLLL